MQNNQLPTKTLVEIMDISIVYDYVIIITSGV